jgi:hypothetical protein
MTKQEAIDIVKATEFNLNCKYLVLVDPDQVSFETGRSIADGLERLGIDFAIIGAPPKAVRVVEMERPEKLEAK